MDNLIAKLPADKIKINWNNKPIPMELFLSFLTVEVERSEKHLGSDTGWTLHENKEHKLLIYGGNIDKEYLDRIEYGYRLHNSYHNNVNPFYIFPILNTKGKIFFLNYYESDILDIIKEQGENIDRKKSDLLNQQKKLSYFKNQLNEMINSTKD